MQLIYVSPVTWDSFAQRPHKFVEWFHQSSGGNALWVEPYPTRLPTLYDLRNKNRDKLATSLSRPSWLTVLRPRSLPIEPLPGLRALNNGLWSPILKTLSEYSSKKETMLVVGKPSRLALMAVEQLQCVSSIYDAMDDFPSFYKGLSRLSMRSTEEKLVAAVGRLVVSSTVLAERWRFAKPDLQIVRNGLDLNALPPTLPRTRQDRKIVLGYLGTIGAWFDWQWLTNLAESRPNDTIRLIGPVFAPVPLPLPTNIELLPPLGHTAALLAMREFDVGLIPFKRTTLTGSVDPIKYYEYRALGIPVISTDFGEMSYRNDEDGVFLSRNDQDIPSLVEAALAVRDTLEDISNFKKANSWASRFSKLRLFDENIA